MCSATTAKRRKPISPYDEGSDPDGRAAPADTPGTIDPHIRARYLEYCAARISEVFLSLSDERTYALMEEAARDAGIEIGSLGFPEMMDLVTERLRADVPLPGLATFAAEYRADPEKFADLMLDPSPSSGGEDA